MAIASDPFDAAHFAKVRLPAAEAEPLPHWAYTSAAWFERERERIFARSWNYVGHESQLPVAGDYLTTTVAGVPLIVVRGQENVLRALCNSCRHRGTKLLAADW